MHELGVAQEIISIVEKEMARLKLKKVEAVNIRLGALTGLNPDALSFGFEAGIIDTPLADAKLIIERIPIKGKCRTCRKNFEVDEFTFVCPHCCSTDMEITQGEELDIDHLVGE